MSNSNFSRQPAAERRMAAAIAGHREDSAKLLELIRDEDSRVRASCYRALNRIDSLSTAQLESGLRDISPVVRRTCAELSANYPEIDLLESLGDGDDYVVEMAAWSLGEHEIVSEPRISALIGLSAGHENPQCREQAVASLGAIGDESGLDAILRATKDKATVRRRAIIALAPFSGKAVDAALNAALEDRDWQVRQAAEDQLDISS